MSSLTDIREPLTCKCIVKLLNNKIKILRGIHQVNILGQRGTTDK